MIEKAFDIWSEVADIEFVPTLQRGLNRSIDISFGSIDGPGGTLAQAYYPDDVNPSRIAGDIQFDNAEQWESGNSKGAAAFDLLWVAVHEIGHSLGLDHSSDPSSVLKDSVSPNEQFVGLSQSDIHVVRSLYASAETSAPPQTSTHNPPTDSPQLDEPKNGDQPLPDPGIGNEPQQHPTPQDFLPNSPRLESPRFEVTPPAGETFEFWTLDPWSEGIPDFRRSPYDNGFQSFGQEYVFDAWWQSDFRAESQTLDVSHEITDNHNPYRATDTRNGGQTSALDALIIINELDTGSHSCGQFTDVNADGQLSALDALHVINSLNRGPLQQQGSVKSGSSYPSHLQNTDVVFANWGHDWRFI